MSREILEELRQGVSAEMQTLQAAVNDYDGEVAVRLGVNRTDLRCLEILLQRDGVAPTELGRALGLTTGSVTAMLDRLERHGYLTRSPDPGDRRKVVVRMAPDFAKNTVGFYESIAEEGYQLLTRYSAAELELLVGFLRSARELYERNITKIRSTPPAKPATRRGAQ